MCIHIDMVKNLGSDTQLYDWRNAIQFRKFSAIIHGLWTASICGIHAWYNALCKWSGQKCSMVTLPSFFFLVNEISFLTVPYTLFFSCHVTKNHQSIRHAAGTDVPAHLLCGIKRAELFYNNDDVAIVFHKKRNDMKSYFLSTSLFDQSRHLVPTKSPGIWAAPPTWKVK